MDKADNVIARAPGVEQILGDGADND